MYTHQRNEHIPGVRFCKYLLVNLLTGRHVCFSYFAFIFSPLDCVLIGCLIGLNLKKTDPKQAIEWKKCIKSSKKHHPVHTKHNSAKKKRRRKKYVKLPFEQAYYPPQNAWGHISTLDSTHLFIVRLFFQKDAMQLRYATFWKLQTSATVWTHYLRHWNWDRLT